LKRGQATVELALGSLVFITVLMFGIYFSEIGWLSLKVTEASNRALWDVTGQRMHDYVAMDNDTLRDQAIARAQNEATFRYADYSGFNNPNRQGIKQVMAKANAPATQCSSDPNIEDWSDVDTTTIAGDKEIFTAGGLQARSGVRCGGEGSVELVNMPRSFADADSTGFFKARQWDARGSARLGTIKLCAVGRPRNGQCSAKMHMLVDDWGLQGDEESGPCMLEPSLTQCANSPYKKIVSQVWSASFPGLQPTQQFALYAAGAAPINPNTFWFSYSPRETGWVDLNYPPGEGINDWHTGTGAPSRQSDYANAYGVRKDFWLGKPQGWKPSRP
jgi:hypothetical protein